MKLAWRVLTSAPPTRSPFETGLLDQPPGMVTGRIDKGAAQARFHWLRAPPVLQILFGAGANFARFAMAESKIGA